MIKGDGKLGHNIIGLVAFLVVPEKEIEKLHLANKQKEQRQNFELGIFCEIEQGCTAYEIYPVGYGRIFCRIAHPI